MLLDAIDEVLGRRVLCTTLRRGQFAAAVADRSPDNEVTCFLLDVFLAKQTLDEIGKERPNVSVHCEADFPEGPFDTVALPFLKNGEAELTRELLQQAHERLDIGGRLIVSTDNPNDTWIHEQLQLLFDKVTKRPQSRGVLYLALKTHPLRRVRDFTANFTFRDGKRLVHAASRPSVFSHRKLDVGARALLEATANARTVKPGYRILDLGCGSGTVGLALALRKPGVHVHAMDSNPRALQCTLRGAELNGLTIVNQPVKTVQGDSLSDGLSDGKSVDGECRSDGRSVETCRFIGRFVASSQYIGRRTGMEQNILDLLARFDGTDARLDSLAVREGRLTSREVALVLGNGVTEAVR
ncbi:MAG: methyltransferase, partial [Planctomycetaceae bacterium]|nr:methyltransferase [Planctomycetaceae bacterium]